MATQHYLYFEGRADEAFEFYKKALGAEVQMILRHKDSPEPVKFHDGRTPPGEKVMHATVLVGGTQLMASDGFCSGKPNFSGFALCFEAKDEVDAKKRFEALSTGGKVNQPLIETFFARAFGVVTDQFGLSWMILAGLKNTG